MKGTNSFIHSYRVAERGTRKANLGWPCVDDEKRKTVEVFHMETKAFVFRALHNDLHSQINFLCHNLPLYLLVYFGYEVSKY